MPFQLVHCTTFQQVVMDILFDGIKHAQSYISLLIEHRSGAICDLLRGLLIFFLQQRNYFIFEVLHMQFGHFML